MKIVFALIILFIPFMAYALECQWWQIKVSASDVDKHPRQQTTVRQHPRIEHCRNKWKDADIYIRQFKDDPIIGWSHQGEVFKKWNKDELQLMLEILPALPPWTGSLNYYFRRAKDSIHKGNPATSELTYKSIIFYDQFFKAQEKKSVIVHESSHHLYKNLAPKDIARFLSLSGWTLKVTSDGKIFELPAKKLILPDSSSEKDEDFANHVEVYFNNSKAYKASHPKLYEFFNERYPL